MAPLYLPIIEGGALKGLYGLLSQTPAGRAPAGADDARGELIEGIIEQSEDESLMERYLEGEELDVPTLVDDLETAVARGSFHPVIPVCASSSVGLDALLEVLVGGFPSPLEHPLPGVTGIDGAVHAPLSADPDGPTGRGGRAHLRRRLRRAGVAGARLLRHAASATRRCT